MPSRRDVIRSAGASLAGSTASLAVVGSVAGAHLDSIPEHVTIRYDESFLERYQPELVFPSAAGEKFLGLHGWVATSEEYETDACVYWAEYSHQDGWLGNLDSHHGDHEPCYVFVDSETGAVQEVVASVYHWIAGRGDASAVSMTGSHPHLRVMTPHHQYTAADRAGQRPTVEDLTASFETWLENGLEGALEPGTVVNPWLMQARGDWWRRGQTGVSLNAMLVRAAKQAGIDQLGSLSD